VNCPFIGNFLYRGNVEAKRGPSGLGTGQLRRAWHLVDLPNGTSMYGPHTNTERKKGEVHNIEKEILLAIIELGNKLHYGAW
jgi:hypothetical protein